jgi:hypothetical protein
MRSLTVNEFDMVSGGTANFDDWLKAAGISLSSSGCGQATTDSNGIETVTICSGRGGGGDWIGTTLLGFGIIGGTGGMVWGGTVAAGHLAGTGFLAPLLLAEGVYAGGMLGLTVGLAAGTVVVGGILIAGGVYYAVTYTSTGG